MKLPLKFQNRREDIILPDLIKGKKTDSIGDLKMFSFRFNVSLEPSSFNEDVLNILKWNDAKITRVTMSEY